MAGWMRLFGKWSKSPYAIVATDKCKGIGQCAKVCPMGIDVELYAHKNRKPVEGSWGLDKSPCIGCGGCISACPLKALHFKKILGRPSA